MKTLPGHHLFDARAMSDLTPNRYGQDMFWTNRTNLMDIYIGNNVGQRVK